MKSLLVSADSLFYAYFALSVLYVLIFSLYSLPATRKKYTKSSKYHNFIIFIPSYGDDSVIFESINSALNIDYPKDLFEIMVISENMKDETNKKIKDLPVNLLIINSENSSKANALNEAINACREKNYNIALILDSDNTVEPSILEEINNAYFAGSKAIQAHRIAKNPSTPTAILDAISEEINNSIFRKGHINMGLSSALIGSGMAIDYKWFAANVSNLKTAGEDKELELLLLKDGIFINYLDYVKVYDEKVKTERIYFNQRKRWLAAQFGALGNSFKELPLAIRNRNFDLIDKIIQWMLLPRVVMIGILTIVSVICLILDVEYSIKWFILLVILTFALTAAIPDYLITKTTVKSLKKIPLIFLLTIINLFRIRGTNKNFIHTQKGK